MAQVFVPDSLPLESQNSTSQRPADWGFEPTQLSQPYYSQTQQNTQGFPNSQIEPRRKYCKCSVQASLIVGSRALS
jgi:hypothetical protein